MRRPVMHDLSLGLPHSWLARCVLGTTSACRCLCVHLESAGYDTRFFVSRTSEMIQPPNAPMAHAIAKTNASKRIRKNTCLSRISTGFLPEMSHHPERYHRMNGGRTSGSVRSPAAAI